MNVLGAIAVGVVLLIGGFYIGQNTTCVNFLGTKCVTTLPLK